MPGSLRKIVAGPWESPVSRDLVVDGYPYSKLCYVKDGIAARYKGAAQLQAPDRQPPGHWRPAGQLPRPRALLSYRVDRHEARGLLARRVRRRLLPAAAVRACSELAAVQDATLYAERVVDIGRRTPAVNGGPRG